MKICKPTRGRCCGALCVDMLGCFSERNPNRNLLILSSYAAVSLRRLAIQLAMTAREAAARKISADVLPYYLL